MFVGQMQKRWPTFALSHLRNDRRRDIRDLHGLTQRSTAIHGASTLGVLTGQDALPRQDNAVRHVSLTSVQLRCASFDTVLPLP
jgi:hypothetical protein